MNERGQRQPKRKTKRTVATTYLPCDVLPRATCCSPCLLFLRHRLLAAPIVAFFTTRGHADVKLEMGTPEA
ncbi:hypothetical protein E2562_030171 [Oryza meyeriana var. granulata]|uniref:Uncharacterized protein n=1 Tax=Oryza meyeriana var. granulata TaxID=110450 RepID=A0A6G1BPJ3_9ORYZ|nr:hypothetical protein E2562_030171 [Oryza meyeriana var. granulata]